MRIVKGRQKKEEEKKEGGESAWRKVLLSNSRSVALTTILVRNAIKRVIQVVIVIPLPRARAFIFHPPGVYARVLRTRRVVFPGSLACSYAVERRSAEEERGSSLARGEEEVEEKERRPDRGWSLKVRGTGLIGLGCQ